MDRLDKIDNRLTNIEKHIERVTPMVEEYYAEKIMRKRTTERLKFFGLILGTLMMISTAIQAVLR